MNWKKLNVCILCKKMSVINEMLDVVCILFVCICYFKKELYVVYKIKEYSWNILNEFFFKFILRIKLYE